MIVIKKIEGGGHGHHGGAWKVAFADFMTAMMAFFLVMWLLGSTSEETKKNISEYFSTPSVIEYEFSNYGAEITLEKLFRDFMNEPLTAVSHWLRDADQKKSDMLDVENKQAVVEHLTEELGGNATSLKVEKGIIEFELPEHLFFKRGTSDPSSKFVETISSVTSLIKEVRDVEIQVTSVVYVDSVSTGRIETADLIAEHRAEIVKHALRAKTNPTAVGFSHRSFGVVRAEPAKDGGMIKISILRAATDPERKFEALNRRLPVDKSEAERSPDSTANKAGEKSDEKSADKMDENQYDRFVDELTDDKK